MIVNGESASEFERFSQQKGLSMQFVLIVMSLVASLVRE
jgi:hypothetical protein